MMALFKFNTFNGNNAIIGEPATGAACSKEQHFFEDEDNNY